MAYVSTNGLVDPTVLSDALLRAWGSGGIGVRSEPVVTLTDRSREPEQAPREFNFEWPGTPSEPEHTLLAALLAIPLHYPSAPPLGIIATTGVNSFRDLVSAWKRDTLNTSSMTRMVLHPAYQRIIGLGPSAVPQLLAELRREPDWWFAALQSITGEDPVAPAERGDLLAMTSRWIAWGRQRGYVRE